MRPSRTGRGEGEEGRCQPPGPTTHILVASANVLNQEEAAVVFLIQEVGGGLPSRPGFGVVLTLVHASNAAEETPWAVCFHQHDPDTGSQPSSPGEPGATPGGRGRTHSGLSLRCTEVA